MTDMKGKYDEEDAGLRRIMEAYDPELTSDAGFMSRLRRDMNAMELVKSRSRKMRDIYRRAVAIAAVAGFFAGGACTIVWQTLMSRLRFPAFAMPQPGGGELTLDWNYVIWLLMAIAVVAVSVNAYELAVSRLSARVERR